MIYIKISFFILFFLTNAFLWRVILNRVFRLEQRSLITCIFAATATIFLLAGVSGVFVAWFWLNGHTTLLAYGITSVISLIIFFAVKKRKTKEHASHDHGMMPWFAMFPRMGWLIWVFWMAYGAMLYFLLQNKSVDALTSPWQAIHPYVLPLFFCLSLTLGVIIFSKEKVKTILFLLVAYSFLIHSYLPLSHVLPWGGDVWRHIALETRLAAGEPIPPVLIGTEARFREMFGMSVPEALIIPNKYVYGHFWGLATVLHTTLGIDLITLNMWLVPILWSLVVPLACAHIGRRIFGSWRCGALFAWLLQLSFSFQVLGAITLPVSLGTIFFLFTLMLWLHYLEDRDPRQRNIVLFFALLMLFGYTVYTALIWFVIISSYSLLVTRYSSVRMRHLSLFFLLIISVLFFPLIELAARTSHLPVVWDWMHQFKQLIGQFSGWYYASAIRPHDILSGNIFFNHTPADAFVSNIFTAWRWHVMPVMFFILIGSVIGWVKMIFNKEHTSIRLFGVLTATIVGGYMIGWFFLEGDRSFVRRLDPMMAFMLTAGFVYFVLRITYHISRTAYHISRSSTDLIRDTRYVMRNLQPILMLLFISFFSWFAATAYASGPDMRVASQDEFQIASLLSDNLKQTELPYCILADTWTLLVLEGISGGRIVGGGFPIDSQFGQPERIQLLQEMRASPQKDILDRMHTLTTSPVCQFVAPKGTIQEEQMRALFLLFGGPPVEAHGFLQWQEGVAE